MPEPFHFGNGNKIISSCLRLAFWEDIWGIFISLHLPLLRRKNPGINPSTHPSLQFVYQTNKQRTSLFKSDARKRLSALLVPTEGRQYERMQCSQPILSKVDFPFECTIGRNRLMPLYCISKTGFLPRKRKGNNIQNELDEVCIQIRLRWLPLRKSTRVLQLSQFLVSQFLSPTNAFYTL